MKRINFLKTLIGIPVAAKIVSTEITNVSPPVDVVSPLGVSSERYGTYTLTFPDGASKVYPLRGDTDIQLAQNLVDKINSDPAMKGIVKAKLK